MKNLRCASEAQLIKPERKVYMSNIISQSISLDNINIRSEMHEGVRYYSVIDSIQYLLEESENPRNYWNMLKIRMLEKGIQLSTNCVQLKLLSKDGKYRETDCATQENIFYIVQYIPSKKSSSFKEKFAKIVNERIEEERNPELAVNRARRTWHIQGRDKEWISARIKGIDARHNITDTWKDHGIKESEEYKKLSGTMHKGVFNKTVSKHKEELSIKGNIRDHLSKVDLAALYFAEIAAEELTRHRNSHGYKEVHKDVKEGSTIGADALSKYKKLITD